MRFETEMEIVRCGLLSGEIEDAASRLRRDIDITSKSDKERYILMNRAFNQIMEVLRNQRKPADFLADLTARERFILFSDLREIDDYLSFYRYNLYYSLDRYNVRYPVYDGKRCDDL
ncbi:MAG: hypothetical protein M1454_04935 [Candidatus Thermoplasmatota archaeon]|nr:hypothetical protein [Candidatus Thermoplasmatota archaeon]MCL5731749.1 hypothetical protein [Candidatus Thermoplasmatota archaeon]